MNILKLTRTGERWPSGLDRLRLDRLVGGVLRGSLVVCSGQPGRQTYRTALAGLSGSMEPIPEGRYRLGPVEWRGRPGDYSASWGAGLGPVWISLIPLQSSERGDFGLHWDANSGSSPGSAGCVVMGNVDDLRTLVAWQSGPDAATELHVDWGLGAFAPEGRPAPELERWKLYANPEVARAFHGGTEVPHGHLEAWINEGRAAVKLNGTPLRIRSLTVEIAYDR